MFDPHLRNCCCGLSFFIMEIAESPQTNGLICTCRDDERSVGLEFNGGDTVSVADEIAAMEESRLLLTTGSETLKEETLRLEARDAATATALVFEDFFFFFEPTTAATETLENRKQVVYNKINIKKSTLN